MKYLGRIYAEPDPPGIDRRRWIDLIGRHPNLVLFQPGYGINPFTKERLAIRPKPDTADVIAGGRKVGFMEWAYGERTEIIVSAEPGIIPLAMEIAETLGGRFEEWRRP